MKDFCIKSEKIRSKLVSFTEEIFNGKILEQNIVFCAAKMSVKE